MKEETLDKLKAYIMSPYEHPFDYDRLFEFICTALKNDEIRNFDYSIIEKVINELKNDNIITEKTVNEYGNNIYHDISLCVKLLEYKEYGITSYNRTRL